MATNRPQSPEPAGLNELLICPVCLDSYKEPKTLQCLHSFCSGCLENCRRPYRRDISCPVCKRITHLTPGGIQGLQSDFRIQQIRDILLVKTPEHSQEGPSVDSPGSKICDLCKTQAKKSNASCHCIQCFMYFCGSCVTKHNSNPLFASHHVINMSEDRSSDVLFCKAHRDHPVRYFCKPCSIMLCTICTMEHEPSHCPEPLEKGIIEKYRQQLGSSLRTIKTRLSEVKTKTKYLQTVKQTHQKALYEAQHAIRSKTEEIIAKIREQEQLMLGEVQKKIEDKMKENGIDNLGEINFHMTNIESLYSDVKQVIKGSPQQCLIAYEDLISRMKQVSEASLPSVQNARGKCTVRFIPAHEEFELKSLIGSLQECSISDESGEDEDHSTSSASHPSALSTSPNFAASGCPSPTMFLGPGGLGASPGSPSGSSGGENPWSPTSPKLKTRSGSRRLSILNALSPSRKTEVKIGKVKAFNTGMDKGPSSPKAINADDLLNSNASESDDGSPSTSMATNQNQAGSSGDFSSPGSPSLSPGSPNLPPGSPILAGMELRPRSTIGRLKLVFKVDQVGGWPGKITSPSGVAFMPDGNVIVAECENRLQVFDKAGQSVRIIGWGKVKPQSVTVTRDGLIAITDKKDRCVKLFSIDGEFKSSWGQGMFDSPSGIAVFPSGNFVITDVDRHMLSIHRKDGSILTQFGSWGSGDYQFNGPAHVTVDNKDNLIVSDTSNGCIKIFDKTGTYVRKISFLGDKNAQIHRPQGICTDKTGNIIVCDRDTHKVTMFSSDGRFIQHLLSKHDNIKYPCGVAVCSDDNTLALVESHTGFLTKDPHHAVKLFKV